ncbi:MAG: DUF5309 family protein [Alphaproteobacteria bacterium]|nr:DUF5309 family protein [Alphaproteobacteria bacterium]
MTLANTDFFDLKDAAFKGLVREDVMDQIYDVTRIPLPFTDLISSDSIGNARAEWTIDALADPDITNATVDGADAGTNDGAVGSRVSNFTQLPDKVVKVSDRARAGNTIGFTDTLAYQIMMRQQELRRDVEAIMLLNQASQEDDGDTVPGLLGGLPAWLTSSTSSGAGGADGGFNFTTGLVEAATPGDGRALTETLVRQIAGSVWEGGSDPSVLMSVPAVIAAFSQFMFDTSSRIARLQRQTEAVQAGVAIGYVDVFLSDFNVSLEFVPNRLQQTAASGDTIPIQVADVFILSPAFAMQGFLQGYEVQPLAREGTADNRQMTVDVTLKVLNEAAHGVIRDVDPTLAVTA